MVLNKLGLSEDKLRYLGAYYSETFDESDVSVTHNDTAVSSGNIELLMQTSSTTADRTNDDNSISDTTKNGVAINPNTDLEGISATISGNTSGHTTAYLTDDTGTTLTSKDVSGVGAGGSFTFNQSLSSGTEYWVVLDAGGNSYTAGYNQSIPFPFTSTDVDITAGVDGLTRDTVEAFTIDSVTAIVPPTSAGDALIRTTNGIPQALDSYEKAFFGTSPDGETVTLDVESVQESIIDNFEDGDITTKASSWDGWNGDTPSLSAQNNTVISGSFSGELVSSNESIGVNSTRSSDTQDRIKFKIRGGQTSNSNDNFQVVIRTSGAIFIGNLRFADSGEIRWYNGETFSDIGKTWSSNTTYTVELNPDFANDEFEIIIDGTIISTESFANSVSGLGEIEIQNITVNSGSTRSVYFDDLNVFSLQTELTDISNGADLTSLPTDKELAFRVNLSRNDTSNNPTFDYLEWWWLRNQLTGGN